MSRPLRGSPTVAAMKLSLSSSRPVFRATRPGGAWLVICLTLGLLAFQGCGGGSAPAVKQPAPTTPQPLIVSTSSLPVGTTGAGYAATLAATGGTGTLSWSLASGTMPAGLALSSAGAISGTPTSAGIATLTFKVADSASPPVSATASLKLTIDSSPMVLAAPRAVPAVEAKAYTDGDATGEVTPTGGALVSIVGGSAPYTCSVSAGSLPPGMTLSEVTPTVYPAGLCTITGTATQAGSYPLTVQVQDALQVSATQDVTFVVRSSSVPVLSAWQATSVSPTQEKITWTTDVPATSKVCYSVGYDVNTCTTESDTAGVTSHAVTISGLWPSNSYQYFLESRGVANGAPQDSLTANDGLGCCAHTFQTPAADQISVPTSFMNMAGPHTVIPGYPIYVGIYYGPTQGAVGTASPKFTVTGLPPFTKIHWPDQQDNGLQQGTISTAASTDDSIAFSGLGGNDSTQFELLTNVGGTTPVGTYKLTVTGNVSVAGVVVSTVSLDWNVTVATPAFTAAKPAAIPPIPDLAVWEANMIAPWPSTATESMGYWYNGQNRVGECEPPNDDQGIQYYDGAWVFDQIGVYTGKTSLWTVGASASPCASPYTDGTPGALQGPQGAASAMSLYHQFLTAHTITNSTGSAYAIPGYWVFPHGLYYACKQNGDTQACDDLHKLANGTAGMFADTGGRFEPTNVRETCYALGLRRLDYDAGGGLSTLAQVQQLATQCLGDADAIVNGTTGYEQPFMDGLLAQALIEYYMDPQTGNQADPRIPPAMQALADHIYSTCWIPRSGNNGLFVYNLLWQNSGLLPDAGGSDLRNLDLLVAPLYAWVYSQTGNSLYQQEGDSIWLSGVDASSDNGLGWSGKNFSQQYRWSFEYVLWRSGH